METEQTNPNFNPDFNSGTNKENYIDPLKKKMKTMWGLIAIVLVLFLSVLVFTSIQNSNKEQLIKEKIGDFSIQEEFAYQGGTIIKAIRKNGNTRPVVLFFKDNQLERLPDEYIADSIKMQLSEAERENKTISVKYQEEYNTGGQDKDGQDIIYNNIFLMTNELPESQWVKNAMYSGGVAKYQVILIDEFGQIQYKFLSSQIL